MTLTLRPSDARGHANHGWLDTRHTFSFAHYFDPDHMGFRDLRVINEDAIAPGMGFGTHGHHDMEIISYIVGGALEHRDSMGEHSVIRSGEVQRMSAGTGIRHSEYNALTGEWTKFLQIWILPDTEGLTPSYEQKEFSGEEKTNRLCLIAAPDGRDGALTIHQDVDLYASKPQAGTVLSLPLRAGRGAWVQVIDGRLSVNGKALKAGDGAAVEGAELVTITAETDGEFLLFDLA